MFSKSLNDLAELNAALNEYPDNVADRLKRATLYISKGEYNNAYTDYKYVYDQYPANMEACNGVKRCEQHLKQEKISSNTIAKNTLISSQAEQPKKNVVSTKLPIPIFFQNPNQGTVEDFKSQQNNLQNELITDLLKGKSLSEVQCHLSRGAKLTEPNDHGVFPLVAAVYGFNPDTVKKIEDSLNEAALEQWKKVDINIFHEKLTKHTPRELNTNPYWDDLGNWFTDYKNAFWCDFYDSLCNYEFHSWINYNNWSKRAGYLQEQTSMWSLDGDYGQPCIVPERIIKQHINAVISVNERLHSFVEKVESKIVGNENTFSC